MKGGVSSCWSNVVTIAARNDVFDEESKQLNEKYIVIESVITYWRRLLTVILVEGDPRGCQHMRC